MSLNNSINCPLKTLSYLILSSCNITEFPVFLMCSKSLSALDLSSNKIQGSVPKWLWKVGKDSFTYLNLSHNFLTYMEPSLPWTNLHFLDLRSNLFSGPLPISSAPHLSVLFASKNQFFGEMSISSFCNMTRLQVLDLSYNNLSGKFLLAWGMLTYFSRCWILEETDYIATSIYLSQRKVICGV